MKRVLTASLLCALMAAAVGCGQRQPESAYPAAPVSATVPTESSDTGDTLEADDPRAGTNTARPDSQKDIKPEPGTPTPAP